MKKDKFFLILSGCATALIGMVYLHYFGFTNSLFRVVIPTYRNIPYHRTREIRERIDKANFINDILGWIDWIILITTFTIVVLVIAIVIISLLVYVLPIKSASQEAGVNDQD